MTTKVLVKQLAGEEDLLLGKGSVTQNRNGTDLPITKVTLFKIVESEAELLAIDTAKFQFAKRIEGGYEYTYAFNGSSWAEVPASLSADKVAYGNRTVAAKFAEWPSLADYGAVSGADNTTQIAQALAENEFIYLPTGTWSTTNALTEYWRFYGIGRLVVAGREEQVSRAPQTNAIGKFYTGQTFGNYENAAAFSAVANFGTGQQKENTQIQGTGAQGTAQFYQSFDHGGAYFAASNFEVLGTTAASTTYTATSITAPEISELTVRAGMFIWVEDPTGYVGQVTDITGSTATVDGWFVWGTGATSIPPNGTSAWINPNTKIWALNANVFLQPAGMAGNATGFELGVVTNKVGSGANTTGIDVVTLGGEPVGVMYRARNLHNTGYKSELPVYSGFWVENNKALGGERVGYRSTGGKVGLLSQDEDVGVKVVDAAGSAVEVIDAGVVQHLIDGAGAIVRERKAVAAYGAGETISENITLAVLLGDFIKLPATLRGDGRELTLANQTGAGLTVVGNGHLISGAPSVVVPSLGRVVLNELGGNWIR